ncbi:MAG: RNA polymerase sigma factor [Clostridia bacterium]|nr:RNA polymerase sigma factor [Clostridia bacterium]
MGRAEDSYKRYLNGHDEAFEDIVELYYNNLIFFAEGYLHDHGAAEEAALDALLELMIHPKRYSFRSSLKTYLFAVVRNKALSALRRRRAERLVPLESASGVPQEDVSSAVIENELRRRVAEAVSKLPEDMRLAVHLVYFEGMTYSEAAFVLKKTVKQVDNLIFRGKKELKELLGPEAAELLQ